MTDPWRSHPREREKPQPWKAHAACKGSDPELFFPTRRTPAGSLAEARKICAGCTVRAECLDYALENGDPGVWGGTTRQQRLTIQRKRVA